MSKLGAINNSEKLKLKIQKYKLLKHALKLNIKHGGTNGTNTSRNMFVNKIPRLASNTRFKNRCFVTGRPRGFYNAFGLSRITLRQMACNGLMPGISKSSW
ncbi:MAG: 30S ribosomal protein S14 [Candidatus Hodgkinia cicadicola]